LENKGFVVVTGEIGSGKTTLINYLLNRVAEDIHVGLINNTNILPSEFLKMICQEFELDPKTNDKAELIDTLSGFLIDQFAAGQRVVLIIDEAQNLTNDTMEEIRMLSNIETEKHHLIQIILVGQPELRFKLQQRNLKQIVQRVTVQCHLKGLERAEIKQYINHRLEIGGSNRFDFFDKETIDQIAIYSRGIPRLINILCDSALVYGFADELETISISILDNVYEELKALGTFTDYGAKPSASPTSIVSEAVSTLSPDEYDGDGRIELMERKIEQLENKIINLNQKLNFYSQIRTERDDIIIELFQMLKDNMDKRWQMLNRVINDRSTMITSKKKKGAQEIKASGPPNISSLCRHKQTKA
jgi:general secretion pathway protein A